MPSKPYGMICPITHAAEVLEPRWTMPILTEMWAGSTRFNDIRRGIGSISPGLLSKRLKELEALGLVERVEDRASGTVDYLRTQRAIDLEPALNALAQWAQCNIEADSTLARSDLSNLMWHMRHYVVPEALPPKQTVIRFHFTDPDADYNTYWILARPGAPVEICTAIPDYDVDLYIATSKVSLVAVLLGRSTVTREGAAGRMYLSGDPVLIRTLPRWLPVSGYAEVAGIALLDGASPADQPAVRRRSGG